MTADSPLIAVTGATGLVGTRVVAGLAAAGVRQRLVVRDRTRARPPDGADVRQASAYGNSAEMRDALRDADTVFVIPAAETRDRVEQHVTAVDAAVAAGIRRVVYLSFLGASPDATFTLARHHDATEEHIRGKGVGWTFLRMNLYMDFIPSMVQADAVLRGPAGDGRVSAILRDDVAAAAVAALTSDAHDGRTYNLTGRESFSLAEAAELMREQTGIPVRYENETDEEAYASRRGFGAPAWEVEGWVSSYQAIRDGSLARVSGDVRHLTGRDPGSLLEYLEAHPESLKHVKPARSP